MSDILLIHGGFYPNMTAGRFWAATGVAAALARHGHRVTAPDRLARATTWSDEAAHLARPLAAPMHVVAGSNGCSAAVRLAIAHSERVRSVTLCWPATAGDPAVDALSIEELLALGADRAAAQALIDATGILRGSTDTELAALRMPIAVVAAAPPDPAHQQSTVDRLRACMRKAQVLGAFAVPFHPDFGAQCDALAAAISAFVIRSETLELR